MDIMWKNNKISWRKMIKWFCFIGWLFVIFFFSTQNGVESSNISNQVTEVLKQFISNDTIILFMIDLSYLIRKLAHFSEYFILGIFTIVLFQEYSSNIRSVFVFAVLFCIFYACTDEFHQLFVMGRSARILDVFIDSCGSFLAGILFLFLQRKKL